MRTSVHRLQGAGEGTRYVAGRRGPAWYGILGGPVLGLLQQQVVYMLAVEQGLLPHERSLAKEEDIEEERRLAFVGMTRAKEELYLCHARLREFRGQTLYAVPSMFLDELPAEGTQAIDQSASAAGTRSALDAWRGGSKAAEPGWADAGITLSSESTKAPTGDSASQEFAEGMVVRHETYGTGKITEVSGFGALRKVKVRFGSSGTRTSPS